MTRALCLEPDIFVPTLVEHLAAHAIECVCRDCPTQADLMDTLVADQPFHVMFVRLGLAFDAAVFDAAGPALRVVVTPTTGLSHIDMAEAERRGIVVLSLKGHTNFLRTITSTAEQTWALLLAVLRYVPSAHQAVLAGHWERKPYKGMELRDKKLGLLGLGRLGTLVAGYGRAFMMSVIACDHYDEPFSRPENAHVERADFDTVMARADVLSVHLPLEPDTAGLVNAERLMRMKPGAVLINTARGELVDEAALLAALETGRLAGAGLDVLSGDAIWDGFVPESHPLVIYARTHQNLVLSPHLGGYTHEAIIRTRSFMVKRLLEWLTS